MKKYLLPIVAVILAITLNAFTTKDGAKSTETAYYWYEIVNDETVSDTPIDPAKKTMSQVSGGDCQDAQGDICLAGFENLVEEEEPAPSPSAEEDNLLFRDTQ
jgi:hypothetical protein